MRKRHQIILHSLVARHSTLAIDVEIARQIGFDGLEASGDKIANCLDAGLSRSELKFLVGETFIPGIGFLIDIERQKDDKTKLFAEANHLFELAGAVGAEGVEVITGPLSLEVARGQRTAADLYRGLVDLPEDEQVDLAASNLRELSEIAADHNLILYLEALSWTPLNTLDKQLRVIEKAGRDNLRLLVDFWHCYTSGDTPERIAKLDKELLYGIHVCDSLKFDGGIPDEPVLRDVPTGEGVLNLQEWTDAVRATGYEGWWSCELFCRRNHQENSFAVARRLKDLMSDLLAP
ncbi:sugar phosphate isomerase/epimerase family protein [Rhizobium phaseoli]|uniref:sugar phosphate isomerase/epimerase family protein n=1 Tax=Rhizobium phaseoli TaxID=396 RepID=UPI0014385170|nr:sugar phosphate isomerase/epimerase family protein [Rhizobium phaseoli]MDK4728690.1 sugar phosphate isomerase/epimerase [Rhizobium phaseoli]NKE91098.1 sugar phosphate isomerase/epimerase [Rhizobium phaseoli]